VMPGGAQRRCEQSGDPFGTAADQRRHIDRNASAAGHAHFIGCSRGQLSAALSFGTNKHAHLPVQDRLGAREAVPGLRPQLDLHLLWRILRRIDIGNDQLTLTRSQETVIRSFPPFRNLGAR
jgi:hypothetical protein